MTQHLLSSKQDTLARARKMKIHTLFQYIFNLPVLASKVLLALYLYPVSLAEDIGNRSGIPEATVFSTVQRLEKEGLVNRSEVVNGLHNQLTGIVKLNVDIVEARLIEGLKEHKKIVDNLFILKQKALKEEEEAVLQKLDRLEKLEKEFARS